VKLDGQALDQGNIEFHPTFEGGVQSGGRIVNGSYSIPAHEGVIVGTYRVAITDFVPTPPLPANFMPGGPRAAVPQAQSSARLEHQEQADRGNQERRSVQVRFRRRFEEEVRTGEWRVVLTSDK